LSARRSTGSQAPKPKKTRSQKLARRSAAPERCASECQNRAVTFLTQRSQKRHCTRGTGVPLFCIQSAQDRKRKTKKCQRETRRYFLVAARQSSRLKSAFSAKELQVVKHHHADQPLCDYLGRVAPINAG